MTSILYTAKQIEAGVRRVAADIRGIRSTTQCTAPLVFVGNLNGALFFMTDLMRMIQIPHQFDFIQTSAYGNNKAISDSGANMLRTPVTHLGGKHVVFVDDILETGTTARVCLDWISSMCPARLDAAFMFEKAVSRRPLGFPGTQFMFGIAQVPDVFLYGYGLDLDGYQRELPEVHFLSNGGRVQPCSSD